MAADIFGIFSFLNDVRFVVEIIVFAYLVFWLYMTFRDIPLLFALSLVAAGYLIFAQTISITLLVVIFFAFVLMGSQLQMLIWFGLAPIVGMFGIKLPGTQEYEAEQQMQAAQKEEEALLERIENGTASAADKAQYQQMMASQQLNSGTNPLARLGGGLR